MIFLKLLQSFVETLHSEGTPGQVAAGIALGSVLGLTPLLNLHNALAFALIVILNVSFGGAMLGWALFVGKMMILAVLIGIVESVMARLRLPQIPSLLVAACLLSAFGIVLMAR